MRDKNKAKDKAKSRKGLKKKAYDLEKFKAAVAAVQREEYSIREAAKQFQV